MTIDPLVNLAEAYGVATSYEDWRGRRVEIERGALVAILEALDVRTANPAQSLADAEGARLGELVEPVSVAWDGRGSLLLWTPPGVGAVEIDLIDERGAHRALRFRPSETRIRARVSTGGVDRIERLLPLRDLATGYYRAHMRWRAGDRTEEGEALVLAAPRRTFGGDLAARAFGVFAPLYALRSANDPGIGTLGDLGRLLRWTRAQGGTTVGTLPLLATFHDDPEGVSPYAPVSRLAWDELYLDVTALPEYDDQIAARAVSATPAEAGGDLVDYGAVDRAQLAVLQALARRAFSDGRRREELGRFALEMPLVRDYAHFRGARETLGAAWRVWPSSQRAGKLALADVDDATSNAHLYAQLALHEQLTQLASDARVADGPGLYLDLPVGTHRAGFDAWRFPEAFADGLDAGAPPDRISAVGQNWHFAPAAREGLRRSGYRYFIESVRNHMRHAGMLRIDHVMGLHRLWVMPRGVAASEGTYLRYRAEEMWAALSIESHRAQCVVIGEDLGTVPIEVRRAMRRHGVGGSYVLQYEARPQRRALRTPPPLAVASLNTHDMPPFGGWERGLDIDVREQFGHAAEGALVSARVERTALVSALREFMGVATSDAQPEALVQACLEFLGWSPARLVLVSLADLLGELGAANVPGTTLEHPNWQRRFPVGVDQLSDEPRIAQLLEALRSARAAVDR